MFKVPGILLAGYTGYTVITGELHAKSGVHWEIIKRHEKPKYFWVVFVTYAALSIALMTIF